VKILGKMKMRDGALGEYAMESPTSGECKNVDVPDVLPRGAKKLGRKVQMCPPPCQWTKLGKNRCECFKSGKILSPTESQGFLDVIVLKTSISGSHPLGNRP
jgi:hypothetical protein